VGPGGGNYDVPFNSQGEGRHCQQVKVRNQPVGHKG
jgi:hypothetical protein